MAIIDFRLRPPYGNLKYFYDEKVGFVNIKNTVQRFGFPNTESVQQASMDLLLKEMDEARVTLGVAHGRKAFGSNEESLKLEEEYPGKFVVFPDIDPLGGEASVAEIEALKAAHPGIKGILFEPGFAAVSSNKQQGNDSTSKDGLHVEVLTEKYRRPITIPVNDDRFLPIYDICQEKGLLVHMTISPRGLVLLDSDVPRQIDEVAGMFPKLNIVLGHGGYPFVNEFSGIAFKRQNVYIVPDVFGINAPGGDEYIKAANYLLPDKILFGSAHPIAPTSGAVQFYKERIRPEVADKFFYHNAAKLLGLE